MATFMNSMVGFQPAYLVVLAFCMVRRPHARILGRQPATRALNHSFDHHRHHGARVCEHRCRHWSWIADALLNEARRSPEAARAGKLEKLGQRLNVLTRSMNHHIDMQIANARLPAAGTLPQPHRGRGTGHRHRGGSPVSLGGKPTARKSSSTAISSSVAPAHSSPGCSTT